MFPENYFNCLKNESLYTVKETDFIFHPSMNLGKPIRMEPLVQHRKFGIKMKI